MTKEIRAEAQGRVASATFRFFSRTPLVSTDIISLIGPMKDVSTMLAFKYLACYGTKWLNRIVNNSLASGAVNQWGLYSYR
jgi:hypothetical protein